MVAFAHALKSLSNGPLTQYLKETIKREGPLSVADFHHQALYHPRYGYYRHQPVLGVSGDFQTAPEISPLFGEVCGAFLLHEWLKRGSPPHITYVELGPGRGKLVADILRVAKVRPAFLKAVHVCLVDINPFLKLAQEKSLAPFRQEVKKVEWFDSFQSLGRSDVFKKLLSKGPVFLVANEFFDVFSARQYEKTDHGFCERFVKLRGESPDHCNEAFQFSLGAPQTHLANPLNRKNFQEKLRNYQEGMIYEESVESFQIFTQVLQWLKFASGTALIIDYGYQEPDADKEGFKGDSWQALYRGSSVLPLAAPGLCDLSFHVDFGLFCEKVITYGLAGHLDSLRGFLLKNGAKERLTKLKALTSSRQKALLDAGFLRLTHPLQMGNLFKVLCVQAGAE